MKKASGPGMKLTVTQRQALAAAARSPLNRGRAGWGVFRITAAGRLWRASSGIIFALERRGLIELSADRRLARITAAGRQALVTELQGLAAVPTPDP